MSESQWDTLLQENSFSGTDLILRDMEDHELHEISIMVSTAASHNEPTTLDANNANGSHGLENDLSDNNKREQVFIICESKNQMEAPLTIELSESLLTNKYRSCRIIDYHKPFPTDWNKTTGLAISLLGLGGTNLSNLNENEYEKIKELLLQSSNLLWVSGDEVENPLLAMATGLIRSVRWERDLDGPNITILGVANPSPCSRVFARKISQLCENLGKERNGEYLLKDHEFWTARVTESAKITEYLDVKSEKLVPRLAVVDASRALRLTTQSPGMLSKLVFEDDPVWRKPIGSFDVEIEVQAAGLNFRDVIIAIGQLPAPTMGLEGAGVVTRVGPAVKDTVVGDRVVFFAPDKEAGSFQTYFRVVEDGRYQLFFVEKFLMMISSCDETSRRCIF